MKHLALFCLLFFHTFTHAQSDTNFIFSHLKNITKQFGFRTYENLALLNQTATYIHDDFKKYSDSVTYQTFHIGKDEYKNVIVSFGTEHKKRIIIGAHYDVCGNQEGADDNASGIVGLLELARLLRGKNLNYRVDLVAYTLEEPPYFKTEQMGSYIHAKYLSDTKIDVYGMISLEMIGFFKDKKNSQEYPLNLLKIFYGSRGNYITLVKKFGSGKFSRKFIRNFKRTKKIRTKKFVGPKALPGIDFSDHLNYWNFNFSAFMITDTAFYRNKNYHQKSDKMETLDIKRMAKVIDGVLEVLLKSE